MLRAPRSRKAWVWSGGPALMCAVILAPPAPPSLSPLPPERLQPATPVELPLNEGEVRFHDWPGSAGTWLIRVDQRGVDVALAVRAPDGRLLAQADSPTARRGPEVAVVDLPGDGLYRLEVRAVERGVPPGRYEVRVDGPGDLTPEDRRSLPAEAAMAAAAERTAEGGPEAYAAAGSGFERAAELWRGLGRPSDQARALFAAGYLAYQAPDAGRAADLFERARALWHDAGDRGWEAAALAYLGLTRWQAGDARGARPFFEQALEIQRSLGEGGEAAVSLNNVCLTEQAAGALDAALACYEEALRALRAHGELPTAAVALHNQGNVQDGRGEPEMAFESYRQALELHREAGNRQGEAQTLNSVAVLHRRLGEPRQALASYAAALAIHRELRDVRGEGAILSNMGFAYSTLGDLQRAEVHLRQGLLLRRQVGDRRGEASTLSNLGVVRRELGELDEALDLFRQSLALWRTLGDAVQETNLLRVIGEVHTARGETGLALEHLDAALALARPPGHRPRLAAVKESLAAVELLRGEPRKARELLREAVGLYRQLRMTTGEAQALERLAQVERRLGDAAAARQSVAAAVAINEALRTRVDSPELRATFLASQRRLYELAIDLRMADHAADPAAGHDREALALSERARARTLVEMLAENPAALQKGLPDALAERHQALRRRLQAKTERQVRLLQRAPSAEEAAAAELERYLAQADLEQLEAEIRRDHPGQAALARPATAAADEIRRLLDPETLLLEYSLGEERSFLWAVTDQAVESFELPPRAAIEALARELYERASTQQAGAAPPGENPAPALSRILLGPAAHLLASRRLAIVADGALHFLPFAALPALDGSGPLVLRHEVVFLPSASALAEARRRSGRPRPTRQVAVLADPVFTADDARLAGGAERIAAARAATAERGGAPVLARLPSTRQEAEAIAALLPPDQVFQALGFAARRSLLLDGGLRPYRVLHLATHGVLDSRRPELSSVVLSRFDEHGTPVEADLRLQDLQGLDLSAELVVLSGCSTALGREIRGEGLIGITRGFLYAGVPRAVASLWQVQDRATADLMARFYRALLVENQSPAAALRTAQIEILRQPRRRSPYFWAAFTHQGDWR
jgi:CHAT domain-containing protein